MAFQFLAPQLTELQSRLTVAEGSGDFTPVYEYIFETITDDLGGPAEAPKANVDKSVWLWVRGALGVNADDGSFFSEFIRDYTSAQHLIREGVVLSETEIQNASDDIAREVARDILNLNVQNPNPNNLLPDINQIGEYDAGQIAARLFGDNYSPWAGTLLFPFLGEGSFTEDWLIDTGTSTEKLIAGTYDLVSAVVATEQASNLWDVAANLLELEEVTEDNSIGEVATDTLLSDLRELANDTFQEAYGLPDEGNFQIGGDLPLYGASLNFLNALEYVSRPNYVVGQLGDDAGLNGSNSDDTIHAGAGNDLILGSTGYDLIDGGEGTDTLDYSGSNHTAGLLVSSDTVGGTLYTERYRAL